MSSLALGLYSITRMLARRDSSILLKCMQSRPVSFGGSGSTCSFISVRNVVPRLPRTSLVKLTDYFANADDRHALNPSYEFTNHPDKLQKLAEPFANKKNVVIMQNLQKMVKAGLVVPVGEDHMYFAAMNSKSCKLTPLGQHYWRILNKQNKK